MELCSVTIAFRWFIRPHVVIPSSSCFFFQWGRGQGQDWPTRRLMKAQIIFPSVSCLTDVVIACSRVQDCRDIWFEDKNDCESDLTETFFADSQKPDTPESFMYFWFPKKSSTVIFVKGGWALSRSQNDKTSNTAFDNLFPSLRHSL